jgi:hypothetical protein
VRQANARFMRAEEIQQHPKFPPAMKDSDGAWTVPHPRKRRIQADSPLWGIELTADERKLHRFFLFEADNGTSDKGETIWPDDPDMYDGSMSICSTLCSSALMRTHSRCASVARPSSKRHAAMGWVIAPVVFDDPPHPHCRGFNSTRPAEAITLSPISKCPRRWRKTG